MSVWIEVFIVVACVAIVVQAVMLVALVLSMKTTFEQLTKVSSDFQAAFDPILPVPGESSKNRSHALPA